MYKKIILLICLLFIIGTLCSCSNDTSIEKMNILTSFFADKKEGEIIIGGTVASVLEIGEEVTDEATILRASGDDLLDASLNLELTSEHRLYPASIRALVMSEEFSKGDISEFASYMQKSIPARISVDVFTTSDEIEKIINAKSVNDMSGGFALESLASSLEAQGKLKRIQLMDIINSSGDDYGYTVPHVISDNNGIKIDGYSIFYKNSLMGFISSENANATNYFLQDNPKARYKINLDGTDYVVDVSLMRRKGEAEINTDKPLKIKMDFVFKAEYEEGTDSNTVGILSDKLKEKINDELSQTIDAAKENCCDFLNMHKIFKAKYRSLYPKINWSDVFCSADIETNVEIQR